MWRGTDISGGGAVVDTVMNLRFQKILGIYVLAEQLLDSRKDSAVWN